jgi:hypothetical protein
VTEIMAFASGAIPQLTSPNTRVKAQNANKQDGEGSGETLPDLDAAEAVVVKVKPGTS